MLNKQFLSDLIMEWCAANRLITILKHTSPEDKETYTKYTDACKRKEAVELQFKTLEKDGFE